MSITITITVEDYTLENLRKYLRKRALVNPTDQQIMEFLQTRPDIAMDLNDTADPSRMDTYERDKLKDGLVQYFLGVGRWWPTNNDIAQYRNEEDLWRAFFGSLHAAAASRGWKFREFKGFRKPKAKAKVKKKPAKRVRA